MENNNTLMPRPLQEEKVKDYLCELEKDPTYKNYELLEMLDEDLLKIVEKRLEEILDGIMADIEVMQDELYELERGKNSD